MSGISLLLLQRNFLPEDAIECFGCDTFSDLRYWAIEGEEMECPNCGGLSVVEEVVEDQAGE